VVGMGKVLVESTPAARLVFERASAILGYDLLAICLEGPAEKLDSTVYSQPALFVTSLAAVRMLPARVGRWRG
jgi:[acyl-carrier-protein] S-malonyltransferase